MHNELDSAHVGHGEGIAADAEEKEEKRPWTKPTIHVLDEITRIRSGGYTSNVYPESGSYFFMS